MDKAIKSGSKVIIETSEGTYSGILMERPQLADKEHIVLKLDNGYNLGIEEKKIKNVKLVDSKKPAGEDFKLKKPVSDASKPTVSILATGGTIASRVDYITGGVHSAFTAEELVSAVPELETKANLKVKQIFNKFSENIVPEDWVKIATEAYNEIKSGVNGIVIPHGTDTMHYTSAALSFMLKTPVPVVLTGAQRSSDRGSSDAAINLIDAVTVAGYGDFSGVCIVMHEESSDAATLIHPGTKARKFHASKRGAFRTVNSEPIGKVFKGEITYGPKPRKPRGGDSALDTKLDEKVFLLKYFPGMKPEIIDSLTESRYNGIVIEGTGLGHTSETFYNAIKNAISSGVAVAMTSQTIYGRVNMNVYSTGRQLLDLGVIPCADMLSETAYVKMMWVLGHTKDPKKIKEMMQTNIAGEIDDRTPINED
jgi:glutamyl-tRNA(Gln) amidotransferase subunit D